MTKIEISPRFSLTVASQKKKHSHIPILSARKAKEELFMQFKSRRKSLLLSLFHASDMRNIISFPFELMNSNETTEQDSLFKTWVMQWNFNLQLVLLVHFSVLLQVHQVSQHSFSFHLLPLSKIKRETMWAFEENYKMKDKNTQNSRHSKINSSLRWNALGNWVIIIFIGQKPSARIIPIILHSC